MEWENGGFVVVSIVGDPILFLALTQWEISDGSSVWSTILECHYHSWLARPQCASAAVAMTLGLLSSWMEGWPIQLKGCFWRSVVELVFGAFHQTSNLLRKPCFSNFDEMVSFTAELTAKGITTLKIAWNESTHALSGPLHLHTTRQWQFLIVATDDDKASIRLFKPCCTTLFNFWTNLLKLQTSKTHVGWTSNSKSKCCGWLIYTAFCCAQMKEQSAYNIVWM